MRRPGGAADEMARRWRTLRGQGDGGMTAASALGWPADHREGKQHVNIAARPVNVNRLSLLTRQSNNALD